jgi:hypothetical protein
MNSDRFRQLADAIEAGAVPDTAFDMASYARRTDCGTAACIAGCAAILDGWRPKWDGSSRIPENLYSLFYRAFGWLGVDEDREDGEELFGLRLPPAAQDLITPAEAATYLRACADAGEIERWPEEIRHREAPETV